MRRWLTALAVVSVMAGATSANAFTTVQGRIKSVYFSAPGNLPFRVALDTPLTSCAGNFVYIDTTFGNYQAYVAGLVSAHAQQKPVVLVYEVQPNGYCLLLEYGYDR